jgi:hypothetical protein
MPARSEIGECERGKMRFSVVPLGEHPLVEKPRDWQVFLAIGYSPEVSLAKLSQSLTATLQGSNGFA